MNCPTNISITPRSQMVATSQGAPNAYLGSATIYLDMTCDFVTVNRTERAELNDLVRPWIGYEWLTAIGLGEFVGKRVSPGTEQNFGRLGNTHWAANSSTAFELQVAQDEFLSCATHTIGEWPTSGKLSYGPLLNSVNKTPIKPYSDYQFDSKRIARKRNMFGTMAEFSGSFNLNVNQFNEFINWYRCEMLSGSNSFDAGWLVQREFGAWKANWAEPWTATLNNSVWTLNVKLMLLEDETNEAWDLWDIEDVIIDVKTIRDQFCRRLHESGLERTNIEITAEQIRLIKEPFCKATETLELINIDITSEQIRLIKEPFCEKVQELEELI